MNRTNNDKDIIIVGTGGFAKEIVFLLSRIGQYHLVGFIDDDDKKQRKSLFGKPILGKTDFLLDIQRKTAIVIGIGDPNSRQNIFEVVRNNNNLIFPNLIDPMAIIGLDVQMGIGNIFMVNTTFTASINIGNFNMINIFSTIGHDVTIGDFNSIFPSVNISGNVKIDNNNMIGVGSKIIQGVTIGENNTIGAGSVVIRSIGNNTKQVGVPTREIESWD